MADWIILQSDFKLLSACISGAKLVLVDGGNHAMAIDLHRCFHREVLGFLPAR
ncbi:MAG: hypothetical protein NTU41_00085 [Chloroflexi bacterium]|nr:hypothetical protein [Chloroflexota bacterium]